MLDRMLETYLVRVQANSAVGIGTGSAVFKVALDGAAKMGRSVVMYDLFLGSFLISQSSRRPSAGSGFWQHRAQ